MWCDDDLLVVVNLFAEIKKNNLVKDVLKWKYRISRKSLKKSILPKTLEYETLEPYKKPELVSDARLNCRIGCANVEPNNENDGYANCREKPIDEHHDEDFYSSLKRIN